jgi:hypothetical protein
MNSREKLLRVAGAMLVSASAALAGAADAPLVEITAGGSRVDFRPLGSFACLQLTVTGPDLTFEKAFDAGTSPVFELPYPATDGHYRWQISRSDQACGAKAPKATSAAIVSGPNGAQDDKNGRAAARQGRPDRAPSGSYSQSGGFRVTGGSIALPSNAPEGFGRQK